MTTAFGPDRAERARRRRSAILAIVLVVAVVVAALLVAVVVAGSLLGSFQLPLLVAQAAVTTFVVLGAVQARAKPLRARHDAVAAAVPDDAVVTPLRTDVLGASRWLGARAFLEQYPLLVDDAHGFGLWTVRRGEALRLLWRPWDAVREIRADDRRASVLLEPVDADDDVLALAPIGLEGSMPQRMETPGRMRAFHDRLRARHRAACPPDPGSEPPERGRDVDWLGPPDRTPPSR